MRNNYKSLCLSDLIIFGLVSSNSTSSFNAFFVLTYNFSKSRTSFTVLRRSKFSYLNLNAPDFKSRKSAYVWLSRMISAIEICAIFSSFVFFGSFSVLRSRFNDSWVRDLLELSLFKTALVISSKETSCRSNYITFISAV